MAAKGGVRLVVEAITATYMQDNGDWTVQVAGLGKEVEGKAPGIIAARDRADQLVEKLVPEGATPTVVHLLNGSALEFTTAYMTARLSRTETVETPEDTSEDESVATDEATATDAQEPADSDEAETAQTETADDATEQATTDAAEAAAVTDVTEASKATDAPEAADTAEATEATEAADTTGTVEAADTAGEAAEDGDEAPEIEAEVPTQDTQADADSTARAGKRAVPRKELSTAVGGKVAAAYGKRATG